MSEITAEEKTKAYSIVFDDLMGCNMFKGIYDGKNGSPEFMNGIATVMENIAIRVSEETYEKFQNEFTANVIASKEKGR